MNEPKPGPVTLRQAPRRTRKQAIAERGARVCLRGLWLAVPEGQELSAIELAHRVGLTRSRSNANAERKLRDFVNARALTLPYPPAAAITTDRHLATEAVTDMATIITVLAKSSGHVYLRDKEPNLGRVVPGVGVVLLIPPDWGPS